MARKPLNKSLGQDFIKGNLDSVEENNNEAEVITQSSSKKDVPKKVNRKSKSKKELIDRFKAKDNDEKTIRITLDLKASLHRQLSQLSLDTGKSKADIIRQLLNELFE